MSALSFTRRAMLQAAAASLARPLFSATPAQLKLGVTTDEIDEDPLVAGKFLHDFGLSYAEVRSLWGKYNTSQPADQIRKAASQLAEYGVKLNILDTGMFKIPLPPDTAEGKKIIDGEFGVLEAAMERAKIFGTEKVRVFAFTGASPSPADWSRIVELVREAARRAKPRNIRLALENVGGSYVSTGARSAKLLKEIPDENFGLTWDPNNAGASGEKSFPDGFRLLDTARIFHVHLRDYRHRPDGKAEWAAVGDGEFDNRGQIQALLKAGYKGSFTLETHWQSPKGKKYATETSLRALLKIIEQV